MGISGSLALIEQAKFTTQANEIKQIEEAFAIYVLEKQLESAETGEEVPLFETPLTPDQIKELPESLREEINYIREMQAGTIDIDETLPSDIGKDLETGEGSNIYYIPGEYANGKEEAYIYDEQSASVYKVEATIIWGVEMYGYDYGNLLVSQPGLLERAQNKNKEVEEKVYLYKYGDQCTDVTGGWTDFKTSIQSLKGYVEYEENHIYVTTSIYGGRYLSTVNYIDYSKYTKLTYVVDVLGVDGRPRCLE